MTAVFKTELFLALGLILGAIGFAAVQLIFIERELRRIWAMLEKRG